MERARKILAPLFAVSIVAALCVLIAMGVEIGGRMNPDVLRSEAYALGCCWIVIVVYSINNLIDKGRKYCESECDLP